MSLTPPVRLTSAQRTRTGCAARRVASPAYPGIVGVAIIDCQRYSYVIAVSNISATNCHVG